MTIATDRVVFAIAAGPERGFGHLVRCGVLAEALRVSRVAVLRSASPATRRAARGLGWTLLTWREVARTVPPHLIVIDDPSRAHGLEWIRRAKAMNVPVAAIHDGVSRPVNAHLVIDGSVTARAVDSASRVAGPAFAVLRPASASRRDPRRVVIALGGGAHVLRSGAELALAIRRLLPDVRVEIAAGFTQRARPTLPPGCRWVEAAHGLSPLLTGAAMCVVSGGVTLYEACAVGAPVIAVPVVAAQRPAICAMARHRAAIEMRLDGPHGPARVAAVVCWLMNQPVLQRTLGRNGRTVVDGRGTARVAARLISLMHRYRRDSIHAVA
jgi:UDP-2,4-diacetamido-2,4,6-trideoxy-beta-L-altropyranose hydrolase